MKFPILNCAVLATLFIATPGVSATSSVGLRGHNEDPAAAPTNNDRPPRHHHRDLEDEEVGTYVVAVKENDPDELGRRLRSLQGNGNGNGNRKDSDEILSVAFDDGMIYEVKGAPAGWANGRKSGSDRVRMPKGSQIRGATIDVRGGKPDFSDDHPSNNGGGNPFGRALEFDAADAIPRTPDQERNLSELRRHLATVGTRTVLAVRVINVGPNTAALTNYNGQFAPQDALAVIKDDIFGTSVPGGTDAVNLHSQYLACSHGKLDFQPTGNRSSGSATVTNIVDGVCEVEVTSDCSVTGCDGAMRNDVNAALQTAFGASAQNLATHVMHCMPNGSFGGIAYAYINSWNSVYKNRWCQYTSAQLHEIGHNLGLAHSNEGTTTYADQTGFMGYSYSQDDQRMCFNNAKSWQLGWFPEAQLTLNLQDTYTGPIGGQINYQEGVTPQDPILIKIDDPVSASALYIGYNLRGKQNANTNEAANQVTIQTYTGSGYSESTLLAKLQNGQVYDTTFNGESIYVEVNSINTNQDTGTAGVTIRYGGCTQDSDCDDGNACTGVETCVANSCVAGQTVDNCCGNDICEAGEEGGICAADCNKELVTTWVDNNGSGGNTFKIDVAQDILITEMKVHNTNSGTGNVRVWTRPGDYAGTENSSAGWNVLVNDPEVSASVPATGGSGFEGTVTIDPPLALAAGSTHSFHVRTSLSIRYTNGSTEGSVYRSNPGEITFYEGKGCGGDFNCNFSPRVWNGAITYVLDNASPSPPTLFPTAAPTNSPVTPAPTAKPVTSSPTAGPTDSPVTAPPTDAPTNSPVTSPPTDGPTRSPVTVSPTAAPTDSPVTPPPTAFPTGSPVTVSPTAAPTDSPVTPVPTAKPVTSSPTTKAPVTAAPTDGPTDAPVTPPPTAFPTNSPVTASPTAAPTDSPVTPVPTAKPVTSSPTTKAPVTAAPTDGPTDAPVTASPTAAPTDVPTSSPVTPVPTQKPVTQSPVTEPPTPAPVTDSPVQQCVERRQPGCTPTTLCCSGIVGDCYTGGRWAGTCK